MLLILLEKQLLNLFKYLNCKNLAHKTFSTPTYRLGNIEHHLIISLVVYFPVNVQ